VVTRERGYTLMEVVVALAVFGMFLFIVTMLTNEMRVAEKTWPVNFMKHPQVSAVVSRLRDDVLDATYPYYPESVGKFAQTPKTLLITVLESRGTSRDVVWDFSTPKEVHRRVFLGDEQISEWVARGVAPEFTIAELDENWKPYGMRLQAKDAKGKLAIDIILQPRATLMSKDAEGTTTDGTTTDGTTTIPP
jgi:prepilin-type N-terminal cleavage/methylation domain-containing protein